jgi:hypothetical protein
MEIEKISLDEIPDALRNGKWRSVIDGLTEKDATRLSFNDKSELRLAYGCLQQAARKLNKRISTRSRDNDLYIWLNQES